MVFNSLEFLVFFPLVLALHWSLPAAWRRGVLLVAGGYFYWCWSPCHTALLAALTVSVFFLARGLAHPRAGARARMACLAAVLALNLGLLVTFKYFNFVAQQLAAACNVLSVDFTAPALKLLMPLGISFYTFQLIGYALDVRWGRVAPETDIVAFALFVSFFPKLVAGPIERGSDLLPQFREEKVFTYADAKDGALQMLWGFVKKVAIADVLALYVHQVYNSPQDYLGLPTILAMVFFVVQLYCDVSGYADIAIGGARMLGYRLSPNFKLPFFAASTTELWRRWHITLSFWFRDYVYTPLALALRNMGRAGLVLSVLGSFLLIGIWHGAAWSFVVFGLCQGLVICVETLTARRRKKLVAAWPPAVVRAAGALFTFACFTVTCVFFRAASLPHACTMLRNAVDFSTFDLRSVLTTYDRLGLVLFLFVVERISVVFDWKMLFHASPWWLRWPVYIATAFALLMLGSGNEITEFIYFEF